jgi:hypothetical protein
MSGSNYPNIGSNYPNTWHNNPEDLVPQYKNRLATNNVFQLCVVSSESHIVSCLIFPCFLTCYTSNMEIWLLLSLHYAAEYKHIAFSLSLSLSLTHTHTHTQAHKVRQEILYIPSPLTNALYKLHITQTRFTSFLIQKGHHCFHFSGMVAQY